MSARREGIGGEARGHLLPWLSTDSAAMATKVTTALVWLVIVAGPVLGVVALLKAGATMPPRVVAAQPSEPASEGAEEFAVRAWSQWISGEEMAQGEWPEPQGEREAVSPQVAAVAELRPGVWSVSVSGWVREQVEDKSRESGVRYWRIGVRAQEDGQGFGLIGTPVEVAGPRDLAAPELAYGTAVEEPEGELGLLLSGFFQAYLAGQPGLERYTSPGSGLRAPSTGLKGVRIVEVSASGNVDLSKTITPKPGRELGLLAAVRPLSEAGPAPVMQYALTVRGRAGRWEVAALEPAPRMAGQGPAERSSR